LVRTRARREGDPLRPTEGARGHRRSPTVDSRAWSVRILAWGTDLGLCFGKGTRCLVDPDDSGTTACAEVIVARTLVRAGYEAGWLNTHGSRVPTPWTPRIDWAIARQMALAIHPELRPLIGAGGTPDVFASDGDGVLFVELKRHPDRLSAEQAAWLEDALASGVPADSLLVANWTGTG
jgi:hypothetical protein